MHILGGGGLERLHVGVPDRVGRGILVVGVASLHGGIKGSFMMIGRTLHGPGDVERVDRVAGLLAAVVVKVRGAVGCPVLPGENGERAVRHIAGVSLSQRAISARQGVSFTFPCPVLMGQRFQGPVGSVPWITLGK